MKNIIFLVTFLAFALFANAYELTYTYDEATLTAVVTGCDDGTITSVEIPATVSHDSKDYTVVGIGTRAFLNFSALAIITIPPTITSIGKEAFEGTAWYTNKEVQELAYVGNWAYKYKGGLPQNEVLEEGTAGIADGCFMDKGYLLSVIMPNSVTHIGMDAFKKCYKMTSAEIPTSLTSIGIRAFQSCSFLTSVTIPNSVTTINYYAFSFCDGLTSVTLSTALTSIGAGLFYECRKLPSINIPTSVANIGNDAFNSCIKLTSLIIPEGVTMIG